VAGLGAELLSRQAEMLRSYFAVDVDGEGAGARLVGLPALVERHAPDPERIPQFLLRLALDVDFGAEKACLGGVAEALAELYMVRGPLQDEVAPGGAGGDGPDPGWREGGAREWSMRHVIVPAMKALLRPGRHRSTDGTVVEVTRLERLYSIFERC